MYKKTTAIQMAKKHFYNASINYIISYEVVSTNVSSLQRPKVIFCVVVVGNSAGRRRKRTSRVECGDDRTFRHNINFLISICLRCRRHVRQTLAGGVEYFVQLFINVNATCMILTKSYDNFRIRERQKRPRTYSNRWKLYLLILYYIIRQKSSIIKQR